MPQTAEHALVCPQVQINPEAEGSICPQDVPRLFHYLHLSGAEILSQLADKSYKRRLMPGALEQFALSTAKRTLFSRSTNSIKQQDKFLLSSLIPFCKVSAKQLTLERRGFQLLFIRSAGFPGFCH